MPTGVDVDSPPSRMAQDTKMRDAHDSDSKMQDLTPSATEDSVEVVLGDLGSTKVMESSSGSSGGSKNTPPPDQNVFRHPQAVRPRPMRAPVSAVHPHHPPHHPPPHYPYGHHSGSWGYGPPPPHPPPHHDYRGHHPPPHPPPYPVPPYSASSGSFDDQGTYPHPHHATAHYSPHGQYPAPRYPTEEVNVISPNHKGDPHYRPPHTPRPRTAGAYYQYPPTSPVSRPGQGPPRVRNYAIRRGEGAYARAQREYEDRPPYSSPYGGHHPPPHGHPPPPPTSSNRGAKTPSRHPPPVVAESFDSAHHSRHSHPNTPKGSSHSPKPMSSSPAPPPPPQTLSSSADPHLQFYGGGGSWGSFDSAVAGPPPQFDDQRYYGFPPDSPYSPYQQPPQPYSPGALYRADSFPASSPGGYGPPPLPPSFSYNYDDEERMLQDYHPDQDGADKFVTPPGQSAKKNRSKTGTPISSNMSGNHRNVLLPKAAEEIDFEVADPPLEPVCPEATVPSCESISDVNSNDVLCGRGGGTNSQVGNRRFRQLVQEFQPTYLMAKRKEKPLLARTIVLIIRKRGGRFLKKNEESGEMYEVGDVKAEAKTSQALREGLDVRATKSAANAKKKSSASKKQSTTAPPLKKEMTRAESPPAMPKLLQDGTVNAGEVHPHSPEQAQFRKRRRVRSQERFFNDFMPPRAELQRADDDDDEEEDIVQHHHPPQPHPHHPTHHHHQGIIEHDDDDILDDVQTTPIRRNGVREETDYADCGVGGCAGIALDIVTGAAKGSFCLGPAGWRR